MRGWGGERGEGGIIGEGDVKPLAIGYGWGCDRQTHLLQRQRQLQRREGVILATLPNFSSLPPSSLPCLLNNFKWATTEVTILASRAALWGGVGHEWGTQRFRNLFIVSSLVMNRSPDMLCCSSGKENHGRSREIVRETERGVVEFRQVEERWGGSEKQAGITWRYRRARLQRFFETGTDGGHMRLSGEGLLAERSVAAAARERRSSRRRRGWAGESRTIDRVAGNGIESNLLAEGGRGEKGSENKWETEAAATNLFHKRMKKIISFILLWARLSGGELLLDFICPEGSGIGWLLN
jgi:hypothetical protein